MVPDDTAAALLAASPELAPFHAAAAEGRLLVRRCTACARVHWYPRERCPFCAADTAWETASGHGRIYSFTVTGKPPDRQMLAYVTLAEGPMLLTHIVDAAPDALSIGQHVAVRFVTLGAGLRLPVFTPCADPS